MANKYPYRTGARLLMIPVALVVAVIVGVLVSWDAGLLAGVAVVFLAPELCTIFCRRLRRPRKEEAEYRKLTREIDKNDRRNRRTGDLTDNDIGFVPINLINT